MREKKKGNRGVWGGGGGEGELMGYGILKTDIPGYQEEKLSTFEIALTEYEIFRPKINGIWCTQILPFGASLSRDLC